jgi:glucosamine--fructose-6-phosphate aminotransferase (isomerizing)
MMAAEMAEQPGVLRRLAAARPAIIASLGRGIPAPVALLGRGSSANAGAVGRSFLESAGIPVTMVDVDGFDDAAARAYQGHIAVALSQSGHAEEVLAALDRLRARGARTIAMTNDPGSPLAGAAEVHIDLEAGPERAVPATKTFLAQAAALSLVAEALAPDRAAALDLEGLATAIERDLLDRAAIERAADTLADKTDGGLVVGLGVLAAVGAEVALKLMETTGSLWAARSSAEVLHGPVAALRPGRGLVALTGDDGDDATAALVPRIAAGGATVVRIESPAGVPLLAAVRGQELARTLALRLGIDPDQPHGLSKITSSAAAR